VSQHLPTFYQNVRKIKEILIISGMMRPYLLITGCLLYSTDGFLIPFHRCDRVDRLNNSYARRFLTSLNVQVSPDFNRANETREKRKLELSQFELLEKCTSVSQAQRLLEQQLCNNNDEKYLYKSINVPPGASLKALSDGELAIQVRLANRKYKITEVIDLNGSRDIDRLSLGLFCVTIVSMFTALTINQSLPGPDIVRFALVWVVTFTPFIFIGYGIKEADKLQSILVDTIRKISPSYKKRMIQHEAGHFLMGYLLGWPIASYQTNSVKNAVEFYSLSDPDRGRNLARQLGFDKPKSSQSLTDREVQSRGYYDVPFFSREGRGALLLEDLSVDRKQGNLTSSLSKLSANDEPRNSWPFRGFTDQALDQLTVVSVAGVCAEVLAFGNAEGGFADFTQLKQIFNSAEGKIEDRERENRIRYAIGYTVSQLRLNLGVLDDLAKVMDRGGSIAECVLAIENCSNRAGQNGVTKDFDLRRREKIRQEASFFERLLFFGGERNIDTIEDRLVLGDGGGGRKVSVRLPGDDPLYAAIAVALLFLFWAFSGGLSLH
jgi:hypothetical protein